MLLKAIQKWGISSFEVHIIEKVYSEEELVERERYYIEIFNADNNSLFYNIGPGGETHTGWTAGEKLREIFRNRDYDYMKGSNNPNYGKHFSGEHLERLKQSHKQTYLNGREANFKGCKHSDKSKQKMSAHRKGKVAINNGVETLYMFPHELEEYLSKGYIKGKLNQANTTKGRKWMHNSIENIYPKVDECKKYLELGYIFGYVPQLFKK